MPEAEELFAHLERACACEKDLAGMKVLVTAGATQESLDPVRFISNYSTGKMGIALAHACARRGADVTLVCGAVSVPVLNPLNRIHRIDALSAQEMYEACIAAWPTQDSAILCAAVADFAPAEQAAEKIKKEALTHHTSAISLSLKENPDIAKALGQTKRENQYLVGFALETEHEKENALRKMERKNLDAIVLNSLRDKGAGFGTDTNVVTILQSDGRSTALSLQSKTLISEEILTNLFS